MSESLLTCKQCGASVDTTEYQIFRELETKIKAPVDLEIYEIKKFSAFTLCSIECIKEFARDMIKDLRTT